MDYFEDDLDTTYFDDVEAGGVNTAASDEKADTEAVYAAIASGNEDPVSTGLAMATDIKTTGSSKESGAIVAGIKEENNYAKEQAALGIIADVEADSATKMGALTALGMEDQRNNTDILRERVLTDALASRVAVANTQEERDVYEQAAMLFGDNGSQEIAKRVFVEGMQTIGDLSPGQKFKGLAKMMVPFVPQTAYKSIVEELYPDESSKMEAIGTAIVASGKHMELLRDRVTAASEEGNIEEMKRVRDVILSSEDWLFEDNPMNKMMMLNEVFSEATGEWNPESADWDKWMNTFGSVADTVGFISSATKLAKVGKSTLSASRAVSKAKVPQVLASLDPETGLAVVKSALEDGAAAKMLGVTDEELAHTFGLVQSSEDVLTELPHMPDLMDDLRKGQQARADIKELQDTKSYLPEEFKDRVYSDILEEITVGERLHLNPQLSVVREATKGFNGVHLDAVYSKGNGKPFLSAEEAIEATKSEFTDAPIDVLVKDAATDTLVKVEDAVNPTGLFYARVRETVDYGDHTSKLLLGDIYNTTTAARYLTDTAAKIKNGWSLSIARRGNKEGVVRSTFQGMLKPLTELPQDSQRKLAEIFKKFEDADQPTITELKGLDLNTKEIRGFYAYRNYADAIYEVADRAVHGQYQKKGYSVIKNAEMDFHGYGKVYDAPEGALKSEAARVYNVADDTFMDMSKGDELAKLYENGGYLAKMEHQVIRGGEKTPYVIIKGKNGFEISGLPASGILSYRKGYIPRYYDQANRYIIEKNIGSFSENGKAAKDSKRAVEVSATKSEAEARIKELGPEYNWRHSKELNEKDLNKADMEALYSRGGVFFSHKGAKLERIASPVDTTVNIIDSIKMSTEKASRIAGSADLTSNMEKAFENQFGELLGATKGKFPDDVGMLSDPNRLVTSKQLEQARAWWNHIDFLKTVKGPMSDFSKATMMRFAEWLDGKGATSLSKMVIEKGEDINISRFFKKANFMVLVASNMARQIILQPSQMVYLSAINPGYFYNPNKFLREFLTLRLASIGEVKGMGAFGEAAKRLYGKDYNSFMKSFKQSGMDDITGHAELRNMAASFDMDVTSNILMKGAKGTANAVNNIMDGVVKHGFSRGERYNRAGSWLLMRDLYKKENPGSSLSDARAVDTISAKAEHASLNMLEGARWQTSGAVDLMAQFTLFPTRVLTSVLPESLGGSKFFTPRQKSKMVMTQLLLGGVAALPFDNVRDGIGNMVNELIEAAGLEDNPVLKDIVRNGFADYMMDRMFSLALGDKIDMAWTKNFSTINAIEGSIFNIPYNVIVENKGAREIFMGPGYSVGNKLGSTMNALKQLFFYEDLTPEQLKKGLSKEMASLMMTNFDKYFQYQVLKSGNTFKGKTGKGFTGEITEGEGWVHLVSGVTPQTLDDAYKISQDNAKYVMSVKDNAKAHYQAMVRMSDRVLAEEDDNAVLRLYETFNNTDTAIFSFLSNKQMANDIMEEVASLIKSDTDGGGERVMLAAVKNAQRMKDPVKRLEELRETALGGAMGDTIDAYINLYKEATKQVNIEE